MACMDTRVPSGLPSVRKKAFSQRAGLSIVIFALGPMSAATLQAQSSPQQYAYASDSNAKTVAGFAKNSTSGALTATPGSPFNEGVGPRALAVDPLGRFLYVLNPGANSVSVFAIDQSTGALAAVQGSPFSAGDATVPQVLAAEPTGKFLYVGNQQDAAPGSANFGLIDTYLINGPTSVLTPSAPSQVIPFNPAAMLTDPKGRFLYVVSGFDSMTNDPGGQVDKFQIDATTGSLSGEMIGGSRDEGHSMAIDPLERFLFVGRGQFSGIIDSYTISPVDGSFQFQGIFNLGTGAFPLAIAVEASAKYLYTIPSSNSIHGFAIDQTTGLLAELPSSPFSASLIGFFLVADPQGPFLYATGGNGILGFRVDSVTGALTQIANVATTASAGLAISGTPAQPVSGPVATLFPSTMDFGGVSVGTTSATRTISVVNTGGAQLGITSISITGTNAADFRETNTCGPTLPVNQNCAVSITFKPSAAGARSAALSVSDSAPGSPQTAPLTGQGLAPQPAVTLVPGNVTFADTLEGKTSPAQSVTLTNAGQATLNILSVTISGPNPADFAQTNDCTSLAPSAGCTIHVTFMPIATGQRAATIIIMDNAPGSPHTVALSGTGDAPFTIGTTGNNPTAVSITAGQTAQFLLQLAPNPSFTGTVMLTCTGAPPAAECQVNPPTIQVNNANAIPFTVTVPTTARVFLTPYPIESPWPRGGLRLLPAILMAIAILLMRRIRIAGETCATRLAWGRVAMGVVVLALAGACGCGGGSSASSTVQPTPTPVTGTPAGTSTLTVTATFGNLSVPFQLTLTVK